MTANFLLCRLGPRQLLLETIAEQQTIGQVGQEVMLRLMRHRFLLGPASA